MATSRGHKLQEQLTRVASSAPPIATPKRPAPKPIARAGQMPAGVQAMSASKERLERLQKIQIIDEQRAARQAVARRCHQQVDAAANCAAGAGCVWERGGLRCHVCPHVLSASAMWVLAQVPRELPLFALLDQRQGPSARMHGRPGRRPAFHTFLIETRTGARAPILAFSWHCTHLTRSYTVYTHSTDTTSLTTTRPCHTTPSHCGRAVRVVSGS